MKTTRRFGENNTSFLGKEPNNGSKPREIQHTTCINISIKRFIKHKNQGVVQKVREERSKNKEKAKRILQSKKGIYPLFA